VQIWLFKEMVSYSMEPATAGSWSQSNGSVFLSIHMVEGWGLAEHRQLLHSRIKVVIFTHANLEMSEDVAKVTYWKSDTVEKYSWTTLGDLSGLVKPNCPLSEA